MVSALDSTQSEISSNYFLQIVINATRELRSFRKLYHILDLVQPVSIYFIMGIKLQKNPEGIKIT